MTTAAQISTDEAEFFPITDMAHWADFWASNRDALDIDEETALTLACNQGLIIGGGAAPLFRIGFVD